MGLSITEEYMIWEFAKLLLSRNLHVFHTLRLMLIVDSRLPIMQNNQPYLFCSLKFIMKITALVD